MATATSIIASATAPIEAVKTNRGCNSPCSTCASDIDAVISHTVLATAHIEAVTVYAWAATAHVDDAQPT